MTRSAPLKKVGCSQTSFQHRLGQFDIVLGQFNIRFRSVRKSARLQRSFQGRSKVVPRSFQGRSEVGPIPNPSAQCSHDKKWEFICFPLCSHHRLVGMVQLEGPRSSVWWGGKHGGRAQALPLKGCTLQGGGASQPLLDHTPKTWTSSQALLQPLFSSNALCLPAFIGAKLFFCLSSGAKLVFLPSRK